MKKIDKDIFDRPDEESAKRLAELLTEADDREKDRIFRRSRALYQVKTAQDSDSVTGVEVVSRKNSFRHWITAAACFALIAGIGGAAFALRPQPSQELSETPEVSAEPVTEEEPATDTEPVTEAEEAPTEPEEEVYVPELHLHEEAPYAETFEEAEALMQEHSHLIPWDQRRGIDTDYYAGLLMSEDYDLNCLEAKSYIYHILLNSQLYYSTARGSLLINYDNETSSTDFQVDMDAQETFEDVTFSRGDHLQFYAYDDKTILTLAGMQYQSYFQNKEKFFNYIEDNYCHIDCAPPDYGLTGHSGSNSFMYDSGSLLVPNQYATGLLMDFDNWQVVSRGNEVGRDCVSIEGSWRDADFTMTVDIRTGILLSIYSNSSSPIDIRMTSLEVDVPFERVEFDPTGYTEIQNIIYD